MIKVPDVYEPKRMGQGRRMFNWLLYALVFAFGINLGKVISDREYQTQRALAAKMEAIEAASPDLAKERFRRQVAQEIERRVRSQVEEQVKAELADAMASGAAAQDARVAEDDAAELRTGRKPSSLQGRMLSRGTEQEESETSSASLGGRKPKSNPKEKPAVAHVFSVELARHASKEDSSQSLQELRKKGLKVFQRKIASEDGPSYRVFVGKFEDKELARAFVNKVLVKKGLDKKARVRKIDP